MRAVELILRSREERAERQREWLARYGLPIVSFTLNIPGADKQSALYARIHDAGMRELLALLPVADHLSLPLPSGSEAILACRGDARAIKRVTIGLEEVHPLGRIFDMDVLDTDGTSLSRRDFGLVSRRCLLCGQAAAVCARQQSHPLADLLGCIRKTAAAYFGIAEENP